MPGGASERPAKSRARLVVLGLTLALVAVAYLDRVCIATAAPAIRKELGFDAEQMGLVFSAFTLTYALFEVPSGWFADRFGPRLGLTRIVLWWSAMTAATGLATGLGSLLVLRALFGMGEAGTFPSTARVYARWLPRREHGAAFGLAIATGAVGGAVTISLVVFLLERVSWRVAFASFGVVGVLWAALWWSYFRDDPAAHPGVSEAELRDIRGDAPGRNPDAAHADVPWSELLRFSPLWALSLTYVGVIYGWYFFLTWMPTYLLEGRRFDMHRMGLLSALPLLCIAVGVWAGGAASDRLAVKHGPRARKFPGLVGFPLAGVATVFAALTPSPELAALSLALAAGLGAFGVAPTWALCVEVGGEHAGIVSGTMNMFGNLGGTLCPIVVGACVKRLGSWPVALGTVAAFYFASAALFVLVDTTRKLEGDAVTPR
ncbi:MAG TPA: MFS transporter [Polyangiaceae bacterium]|nr:MFS transporter [Polyangiaceae bacterium]